MTNEKIDSEVELEEGEIEDDGCEAEIEPVLGVTDSNGTQNAKNDTKPEEELQEPNKPEIAVKAGKKPSRYGKEKASDYNGKRKYSYEKKPKDWTDMLYENTDDEEDFDNQDSDDYHHELEEVRKRIKCDKYQGSPSEDEDDKIREKSSRSSKRVVEGDEIPKYLSRGHIDKKSKIPCKFFLDGNCIKGSECSFSHDKNIKVREKDICKNFKSKNSCVYGKKCRFFHIDESALKGKKESSSRKRKRSSDNDESESPARKIPSLLDLNVIPEGQSAEDVGKVLMIAAKRSVSQKSKVRKPSLLATPPSTKKESRSMKKKEKGPEREEKYEEEEHKVREKSLSPTKDNFVSMDKDGYGSMDKDAYNSTDKDGFGSMDKDERPVMHYNDIDERPNLPQVSGAENAEVIRVEEEPVQLQNPNPISNGVNTRALLGDAPAPTPLTNGPPRMPLLGNSPTNYNPGFNQFSRPAMRPNANVFQQALGQALGMFYYQNMNTMQQSQQPRISGLLPHPVNPRVPNPGFSARPYGAGVGLPMVNSTIQGNPLLPQPNLGSKHNQIGNSSMIPTLLGTNVPHDIMEHLGPLTMPAPFMSDESNMQHGGLCGSGMSGPVGSARSSPPPEAGLKQFTERNAPLLDLPKFPCHDQVSGPFNQMTLRGVLPFGEREGDRDSWMNPAPVSCLNEKSMSYFSNNVSSFESRDASNAEGLGTNDSDFQPAQKESHADAARQSEIESLNKENLPSSVNSNENSPGHASQQAPNESMSVSLTVANEVSFDCKLKGPYCLTPIFACDVISLPHFVNPHDPKWTTDPRVQKHKNDPPPAPKGADNSKSNCEPKPVPDTRTTATQPVPSSVSTVGNSAAAQPQTRDPRLLKRNKKELDKLSQPVAVASPTPAQPSEDLKPKEMEPLLEFLKRYSNLPISDLNVTEDSVASNVKPDSAPADPTNSVQPENVVAPKKTYHNLVVKKATSRLPSARRSGDNSDGLEDGPSPLEDPRSRRKTSLEFQSPLSNPYNTERNPSLQYGLPPNGRFTEPAPPAAQRSSDPSGSFANGDQPSVPGAEASPFIPASSLDACLTTTASVKSFFNSMDPTASPFSF